MDFLLGQQYGPNSPNHASSKSSSKSPSPIPNSDTRIEDGKLFYEKRWYEHLSIKTRICEL